MDAQRALLDELMGAARNLTEEERKGYKEITWDDKEVCGFYMVRFCPHDLFVNTRSDLGPCPRIHDQKLKESNDGSREGELTFSAAATGNRKPATGGLNGGAAAATLPFLQLNSFQDLYSKLEEFISELNEASAWTWCKATKRESMKEEKDAESSLYHSSKFTVNPKHAESSNPLCPFCNASIEPMTVLKCPKCKALLKLSPTILPRPVPEFGIPERSRSVGESARDFQGRVRVYEICEICCDKKETFEMFRNKGCRHSVCTDCISKHIQVKVESNSGVILCPGLYCRVALALDRCKEFLPEKVVERWEKAMIETMIPESEKFYCPFKDCSAMLLNEDAGEVRVIRESECPHCRRLFCVRCRVPWHSEMECQEFQKLNEDEREREDIQLKKLAEEKEWMRCPKCKFYVEKTGGCVHMKCRCGFGFCYRCGEKWSFYHGPCLASIVQRP